ARREEQTSPSALVARLAEASKALPEAPPAPPKVEKPAEKPAVDPSLPQLDVFFSLAKACQAPGARALIVQRKLKALGTLIEMEPPPSQLMQKKGGVRVAALLATAKSVEDVRAAFDGIPEVEQVEVRVAPVAPPPSAEAPQAAPGPMRAICEP